jgi:hypothetical protein
VGTTAIDAAGNAETAIDRFGAFVLVVSTPPDLGTSDLGTSDFGGAPDAPPAAMCGVDCLAQTNAICCLTCACNQDVPVCRPICGTGRLWDCELMRCTP